MRSNFRRHQSHITTFASSQLIYISFFVVVVCLVRYCQARYRDTRVLETNLYVVCCFGCPDEHEIYSEIGCACFISNRYDTHAYPCDLVVHKCGELSPVSYLSLSLCLYLGKDVLLKIVHGHETHAQQSPEWLIFFFNMDGIYVAIYRWCSVLIAQDCLHQRNWYIKALKYGMILSRWQILFIRSHSFISTIPFITHKHSLAKFNMNEKSNRKSINSIRKHWFIELNMSIGTWRTICIYKYIVNKSYNDFSNSIQFLVLSNNKPTHISRQYFTT